MFGEFFSCGRSSTRKKKYEVLFYISKLFICLNFINHANFKRVIGFEHMMSCLTYKNQIGKWINRMTIEQRVCYILIVFTSGQNSLIWLQLGRFYYFPI